MGDIKETEQNRSKQTKWGKIEAQSQVLDNTYLRRIRSDSHGQNIVELSKLCRNLLALQLVYPSPMYVSQMQG